MFVRTLAGGVPGGVSAWGGQSGDGGNRELDQ